MTWDEMQIAVWAEQGGSALREGRWDATATNAYPAAPLAWLELTPGLDPALAPPRSAEDRDYAFASLPDRRRRLALLDTVAVLALLALAGRLLGGAVAVTAGLLIAFDPWLLSQARLFRVEALSADLTALSLVLGLLAAGRGALVLAALSGAVAGAASVTKVTSLYLAVIVPLAFVLAGWRPGHLARGARDLTLVWLLGLAITSAALWPVLWAAPMAAYHVVADYLSVAATRSPSSGGAWAAAPFFGGAVTSEAGPLFYPACLAFRLAPLTCIGLFLWAVTLRRRWREEGARAGWAPLIDVTVATFVCGLIVLFGAATTKAAHYVMPAAPLLILLAAVGLTRAAARRGRLGTLWAFCGVVGILTCVWHHPYYSTSWNLLLGGGRAALRQMPVGQHEGIATLIERLAAHEHAPTIRLASPWTMACEAAFPGVCLPQDGGALMEAHYAITHVFRTQRQPSSELDRWIPDAVRVDAYVRDGVAYATLFRLPPGLRRADLPEQDDTGRARPDIGEVFGFRILTDGDGASRTLTVFARNGRQSSGATWISRPLEVRNPQGRVLQRTALEPAAGFASELAAPGAVIPLVARLEMPVTAHTSTLARGARPGEFVLNVGP